MLVYYFLPFIVNNRYLLFQVSSGHNSVTVQNRTHVRYELFCLESLILSFPEVVQIPPESPCMSVQSGDYFDGAISIVDVHDALQLAACDATWFNQFSSVKVARNVLPKHCFTT